MHLCVSLCSSMHTMITAAAAVNGEWQQQRHTASQFICSYNVLERRGVPFMIFHSFSSSVHQERCTVRCSRSVPHSFPFCHCSAGTQYSNMVVQAHVKADVLNFTRWFASLSLCLLHLRFAVKFPASSSSPSSTTKCRTQKQNNFFYQIIRMCSSPCAHVRVCVCVRARRYFRAYGKNASGKSEARKSEWKKKNVNEELNKLN